MTSMGKVSRRLSRAHRHQRQTTAPTPSTYLAVDVGDDTVMVFGPATLDPVDLAERLESLAGHLRLLHPREWEGSETGRPFTDEVGNEVLVAGPAARDPFNADAIADVLDVAREMIPSVPYAPFLEEAA